MAGVGSSAPGEHEPALLPPGHRSRIDPDIEGSDMGRSSRFSELAGRFLKGLSDDETRDPQEFLEELLRVRA